MAISETLIQLVDIRDDIRQALIDKGIDMTGTIPLSQYPEKIAGIGDFPGYRIKTGELCSIPAKSGQNNGGGSQSLQIPAGCIPLCIVIEGKFEVSSGKGESPNFRLNVWDNNNKTYYYAYRGGGSGHVGNNSKQIFLNPLGAYNGDLTEAATITSINVEAMNGQGNLITSYALPKMIVTMWLEKR